MVDKFTEIAQRKEALQNEIFETIKRYQKEFDENGLVIHGVDVSMIEARAHGDSHRVFIPEIHVDLRV